MASFSLHLNPLSPSPHYHKHNPLKSHLKIGFFPLRFSHSSCSFDSKTRYKGVRCCRMTASGSSTWKETNGVYDPDEKMNRLADEVDKNAGLSRLTLFSTCKIRDRLSTNVAGVPLDRNLIIKALNLYRKNTGSANFFWVSNQGIHLTGAVSARTSSQ